MATNLVTRFHALIFAVTLAATAVAVFRVPADFLYPAHWKGSAADWLWPRDAALPVAPAVEILLMASFWLLGRALTSNHFAKVQHILDPALSVMLGVAASCQLGLLFAGVGSDLDIFRLLGFVLAAGTAVLGVVLFSAQRHTYAGMRMPWPIASDHAWRLVHGSTGIAVGIAAAGLALLAWSDPGIGPLVIAYAALVVGLPLFAGLMTLICRIV